MYLFSFLIADSKCKVKLFNKRKVKFFHNLLNALSWCWGISMSANGQLTTVEYVSSFENRIHTSSWSGQVDGQGRRWAPTIQS